GNIPPALCKLRGAESDFDAIGIMEDHVVIPVDISISGAAQAPAGRGNFPGVRLQNPVANVNDVDVLLHDDVAGKNAVINPIAQAQLGGRSVRPGRPVNVAGEIVSFAAGNLAKRPSVNAPYEFHKRRTIANLESDVEAQFSFGALANFNHLQCAGNINGHRLLQIDVLAGSGHGFQVAGMIVRRRGDYDGVHFLGGRDLLIGLGANE